MEILYRRFSARNVFLTLNLLQKRNAAVNLAHIIHGKISRDSVPIIVLHGVLGNKKNWSSLSKNLAQMNSTAVVAADARNHGESPHTNTHTYHDLASDVSLLMKSLSVDTAHIIGHSMGGRTAMLLALTEPEKVRTLLVLDISPVSSVNLLSGFFPRLLGAMKSINFTGVKPSEARNLARSKLMESGVIEHPALADFLLMSLGTKKDGSVGWTCNVETILNHFKDIASFPDMSGSVYDGPTFFVAGADSNYLPSEDLPKIQKLFPKAELTIIKDAGHNVHAEQPASVLKCAKYLIDQKK